MTKREGAILTAFTGIMIGSFSDFQEYVDGLVGYSTFTHMFGDKEFATKVKELARADFIKINEDIK